MPAELDTFASMHGTSLPRLEFLSVALWYDILANAFSALRAYSNSGKRFGYSSGSARDSAALTLTLLRSSLHNLTISLTLLKFD